MPFSIQTNVNSLVAQENLRVNSNFQSQTIQRLTSGFRINQSGDDAAGLAIANKFRSDTAELTQGVRNANDGISTLQIIDGGMNNIGKMLDRLKTLATQSATETFTGDRSALNKEYQTLVGEIDRQAQSIGLSTGGRFAMTMGVYVGGGTTAGGAASTTNGTVTLDLTNSTVDTKALGLRTSLFAGQSLPGTNLAAASNTSVANIVIANAADNGDATFALSGPNFSNIKISVTLNSSDTAQTTADKLNAAIQGAGNGGTDPAKSLRNANIQVNAVVDSAGNEQLAFTSAGSAFQVTAQTNTANALMGHFDTASGSVAKGASVSQAVLGDAMSIPTGAAQAEKVALKITVNGVAHDLNMITIDGSESTAALLAGKVNAGGNAALLTGWGVTADVGAGGKLQFTGNSNQTIEVQASGDANNLLGLGSFQGVTTTQGAAVTGVSAGAKVVVVGGVTLNFTTAAGDSAKQVVQDIMSVGANLTDMAAAGISVGVDSSGTKLRFSRSGDQALTVTTPAEAALGLVTTTASSEVQAAQESMTFAAMGATTNAPATITAKGVTLTFTPASTGETAAAILANIKTNDAANLKLLSDAGVSLGLDSTGLKLQLTSIDHTAIGTVTSSDAGIVIGSNVNTQAQAVGTATAAFSINGGQKILVNFATDTSATTTRDNLNAAINANAELKAAGLVADTSLTVRAGDSSVKFRMAITSQSAGNALGYGMGTVNSASYTATDKAAMVASAGASQTGVGNNNDVFAFAGLKNSGAYNNTKGANADQQILSFSANDASGTLQSFSVTLSNSNADNVDNAVKNINIALQGSGNSTLKNIVAIKEANAAGSAEGIRFISSLNSFSVNVGSATNYTTGTPVGLYDGTTGATATQGVKVNSSASGAIDISSSAGAKQAVIALGLAVQKLGVAQAAIGKGQNQLGYAINLANSQISNFSSAQAQIRDADVASEAANLSKAQVLQQASIAAMAQANSAPQAVLSLLKG